MCGAFATSKPGAAVSGCLRRVRIPKNDVFLRKLRVEVAIFFDIFPALNAAIGCLGYLQKDITFQDSDPPEAAGHSNWHMFSQKDVFFHYSDPPEAAGHSSTWL